MGTFACSTGENIGDKQKAGDKKTPEGVYFFTRTISQKQLQAQYGIGAFVLNFPNSMDRKEGKQGNGIWLHGTDKKLVPFDSRGCIAMENENLLQIGPYIELLRTPIIIEDQIEYKPAGILQKEKEEISDFLLQWEKSWEEKDVDQYTQCYANEFTAGSRDLRAWRSYKQKINQRYKFIDVLIQDIHILKHTNTFLVSFLQDYDSDGLSSTGFKRLFLQKNSEVLKISDEKWLSSAATETNALGVKITEERKIRRLLNTWVHAWEDEKLDKYMNCYARDFKAEGKSWAQWKEYKENINKKAKNIKISIINPKLNRRDNQATVSFRQQYRSNILRDYGLKTIILQKRNDHWKICGEEWQALPRVPTDKST
jgi:murein L,D-transpeptidase YafK